MRAHKLGFGKIAPADLDERHRARHRRVGDERLVAGAVELRFDPCKARLAAKLARRQQSIESRARVGGKLQHLGDVLGLPVGEMGARRPEAARRLRPVGNRPRPRETLEMRRRIGITLHAPRREPGIPVRQRHLARMAARDFVGDPIGALVVVLDEIGGGDPLAHLVVFDIGQRLADRRAVEEIERVDRLLVAHKRPHAGVDLLEPRGIDRLVAVVDRIDDMRRLAETLRQRPHGGGSLFGLLFQRQLIDGVRARRTRIFGHPGFEFGIFRLEARMQIAVGQHIAHQAFVGEVGDEPVGFFPVAAFLGGENLEIAFAVAAAQHFRAPDFRAGADRRGLGRGRRNRHLGPELAERGGVRCRGGKRQRRGQNEATR